MTQLRVDWLDNNSTWRQQIMCGFRADQVAMLLRVCGNALQRVSLPPCTVRELAEFESRGVKAACVSDQRNLPRWNNRERGFCAPHGERKTPVCDLDAEFVGYPSYGAGLCICIRSSPRARGAQTCSSLIPDSLSHPATARCLARLFHFEGMLLVPDTWAERATRVEHGFGWGGFSALVAERKNQATARSDACVYVCISVCVYVCVFFFLSVALCSLVSTAPPPPPLFATLTQPKNTGTKETTSLKLCWNCTWWEIGSLLSTWLDGEKHRGEGVTGGRLSSRREMQASTPERTQATE